MAEDSRFVPPEQHPVAGPPAALPAGSPLPPPTAPPVYAPPVYAPPAGITAPPAAYPGPHKRRGMPVGGIVGIIVGVLALFILAIVFLVWFVATQLDVSGFPSDEYDDSYNGSGHAPLIEGDRSTPVAKSPIDCADPCFDGDFGGAAGLTQEEADRLSLYIDETYIPASTPHIDAIVRERAWLVSSATPHFCVFTSASAPLSIVTDEEDPWYDEEAIFYNSTVVDDEASSTIEQSVRYFPSSAEASAHMAAIDEEVDACTGYTIDYADPYDTSGYDYSESWDVTRAPALDLPDSVAAVGWVESGEYERGYTFDVQRGNAVVRTSLLSWDGLDEKQFRTLIEASAKRIASVPLAE